MKRRTLFNLLSRAGGTTAVLIALHAMGWRSTYAQTTNRPRLGGETGAGIKVIILGAGIAGMTAAYELTKAGYECILLEARNRAGGRCWTLRHKDVINEIHQQGQRSEKCPFDNDNSLYFNPGPARIPYHHKNILSYCQEFGVPLEVIVNENRAAYFQDDQAFGGSPVNSRRVISDSRGYIAELLTKAIGINGLDRDVSPEEQERLLEFVKGFGDLNSKGEYVGSSRAGYEIPPGAGINTGRKHEPLPLSELLNSRFWEYKMHFGEGYWQAATMLQPVGGMDAIAKGFEQQVGRLIRYNAEVTKIRQHSDGVQVIYRDRKRNQYQSVDGKFAICTIPLSVLKNIKADFSVEHQAAITVGASSYSHAIKVGFQSRRRFWEEDYNIYGGISWTEGDITQIWYPSTGFHNSQGIIVGAYIWSNEISKRWEAMTSKQRLSLAILEGEKIHPGYNQEVSVANGCTVAWGKVPYSEGALIRWEQDSRKKAYLVLNQPDGNVYFAGDHMSYLTGWQEGAILSAHKIVNEITTRVQNS
ncbi:MAG: flavin monoamine oxidase family protein [Okeania sp. SIO2C2]|uniref:flavin monoamine oxidase family protein n=1 Tax=Okeania sp. SIO2C2 TaxID=2607787 RepID=UPI0013B68F4B|nr:flavin monoamine oxidase family protein [Okeania sp. SIO2C2]NEP85443.1 flavin monoamine oxidase family protein [Okeania sp. SIO2C2]